MYSEADRRASHRRAAEHSPLDPHARSLRRRFYAPKMGRPSLTPGIYFRLLRMRYFEELDSERGIEWRAADSLGVRRKHLRGHRNSLKRLLIHVAAFNGSLILRQQLGRGTLQGLRNCLFFCFALVWTVLERLRERYGRPQETFKARWQLLPSLGLQSNAA